jgi:hypothetical protein
MTKGFGQLVVTPQQEQEAKLLRKSVLSHFQHLRDPRVGCKKEHNLVAIVTMAILAVLCGADGFVAIETYGKAKPCMARDVFRLTLRHSRPRYLWSGVWDA